MSATVRPELALIRRGLRDRVARARRVVARATAWPLAVRLGVFTAALAAQAAAYPPELVVGAPLLVLVALAALPALGPRTAAVSVYWLLTVVGWLVSSTLFGVATLPRLLGLTLALYLVHTGAALAAVLPYDAIVDPVVVVRWLLRAGAVTAVSTGLCVAALYWVNTVPPRAYLPATLVGLAVTVGLAWLITRLTRA